MLTFIITTVIEINPLCNFDNRGFTSTLLETEDIHLKRRKQEVRTGDQDIR